MIANISNHKKILKIFSARVAPARAAERPRTLAAASPHAPPPAAPPPEQAAGNSRDLRGRRQRALPLSSGGSGGRRRSAPPEFPSSARRASGGGGWSPQIRRCSGRIWWLRGGDARLCGGARCRGPVVAEGACRRRRRRLRPAQVALAAVEAPVAAALVVPEAGAG